MYAHVHVLAHQHFFISWITNFTIICIADEPGKHQTLLTKCTQLMPAHDRQQLLIAIPGAMTQKRLSFTSHDMHVQLLCLRLTSCIGKMLAMLMMV